ncbi:MAG TPA: hypothetical protein VGK74_23355 [Symbiobacteriaceae bacterium]
MRKTLVMLLMIVALCALAGTASAGFIGPGPTPDTRMYFHW